MCLRIRERRRLCEDVSGVAQLRHFGDNSPRQLEYVFIAEEIDVLAAFLELLVEVWIVVRLPAKLSDVEIRRSRDLQPS